MVSKEMRAKKVLEVEDVKTLVYSGLRSGEEYFDCAVMEEKYSDKAKKCMAKFISLCDDGINPMDALSAAF